MTFKLFQVKQPFSTGETQVIGIMWLNDLVNVPLVSDDDKNVILRIEFLAVRVSGKVEGIYRFDEGWVEGWDKGWDEGWDAG